MQAYSLPTASFFHSAGRFLIAARFTDRRPKAVYPL